jgi:porphobilinogen synthase
MIMPFTTSFLNRNTYPTIRPRRLRHKANIRALVRETILTPDDFVLPLFIKADINENRPIPSMPGVYQFSLKTLEKEITEISQLGIKTIILFGIPSSKNQTGSSALERNGIIQQAIKIIKNTNDQITLISDLCFCEYTDHGHCGIMNDKTGSWDLDNDQTLSMLNKQVLSHVKAGTDIIAPSGMIDGMVASIRSTLDQNGYEHIPILSYAVKYTSSLYAPFREAAEGTPNKGDRKTYQMDPANGNEALKEAELDVKEGTDFLMVKPALHSLDIIYRLKQHFPAIPLGAYHVSGEYAMIKAAAQQGWVDEKSLLLETLISIKRAGADFIIHYACKDVLKWL